MGRRRCTPFFSLRSAHEGPRCARSTRLSGSAGAAQCRTGAWPWAVGHGITSGVWGGTTEDERRLLRRHAERSDTELAAARAAQSGGSASVRPDSEHHSELPGIGVGLTAGPCDRPTGLPSAAGYRAGPRRLRCTLGPARCLRHDRMFSASRWARSVHADVICLKAGNSAGSGTRNRFPAVSGSGVIARSVPSASLWPGRTAPPANPAGGPHQ
jgi:hypothetical protein